MFAKFRKFIQLPLEEKQLFVEAYVTLGIMRAAILTVSFKRLTKNLEQGTATARPAEVTQQQLAQAVKIGKLIETAAVHTPWESACLAQSLTAQRMLKRRKIPGMFCLGALKDDKSEGKMKAHAWTRCGDAVVTGAAGHEAFTVLSVFQWGSVLR